jgi:hypothetical protein
MYPSAVTCPLDSNVKSGLTSVLPEPEPLSVQMPSPWMPMALAMMTKARRLSSKVSK